MGPCVMILGLAIGSCQTAPPGPSPLARNTLACRELSTVTSIHRGGERFQRLADDAMASGRCRLFPAGHKVTDRRREGGHVRFVDPGSGRVYWAFGG